MTRREFLAAGAAGLLLPSNQRALSTPETLYNGIVLPSPWPPDRRELDDRPRQPPYLAAPPSVIDIAVGRQLFVDDFLVEESSLSRVFHRATYHPASPVLTPQQPWEHEDPHAALTATAPSPSAMPFSDGVFFDPAERLFKMWYMAGYQQYTALAVSHDGIAWDRPRLPIVQGTNIVLNRRRDSSTVWLDVDAADSAARYKMAVFVMDGRALRLYTSPDGVRWREGRAPGPAGDRSTFFYNPFRGVWVFSLRAEDASGLNRYRRYAESGQFSDAGWRPQDAVLWTGADALDVIRPDINTRPELYNLDAVAYESLLLGMFTMYRGERPQREKPNDICIGFSRDGFHWHRPWRDAFIPVSDDQGSWNWSNVQSAGGVCLVAGDRLYFYVSGRQGIAGTSLPGVCSTGVATLRRDGFASLSDEWPAGLARRVFAAPGTLTTRPLRFTGAELFVNAAIDGELRVEVLDREGRVIEPYRIEACEPVTGDSTRHRVRWRGGVSLRDLADDAVRFRFALSRAKLYSFWVSPSDRGNSNGYVGAGGPSFSRARDV